MEWILFDKDGTLIEFDRSWEKNRGTICTIIA